jgi:hypothetical protein
MNTVPTSGKELRMLRLQDKISRRRLALFAGRSEERIVQIEKKLYVRADAVQRYILALSAAVEYRSVMSERNLPKSGKKSAETINGITKPNHRAWASFDLDLFTLDDLLDGEAAPDSALQDRWSRRVLSHGSPGGTPETSRRIWGF